MAQLTVEGHAAAAPTLQRAAEALAEIPVEDALRWGWAAIGASTAVWDDEGMRAISARQVKLVRDAGVLAQLPLHLASLALSTSWTGDLAGVASLIAEAESVAAATGTAFAPFTLMRLRGTSGAGRRGLRTDLRNDRASQLRRSRDRRDERVLGRGGPIQRPRPLRGGGVGGPASRLEHF